MSSGLSLADIRIKYSIPANVTDSEVMQFANDSNITINFSATQNAKQGANPFNYNGVGNSIYTSETQATSTGSNAGTSGSTAMSADGSIFGNGYANASVDLESPIEGFAIQRTTTPAPAQQVDTTTFAQWQQSQQVKTEQQQAEEGERTLRADIERYESKDGYTTIYKKDGTVVKRRARKGEEGYQKVGSGDTVDTKIKKWFGLSDEQLAALTPEQKDAKFRQYIQGIRQVNGERVAVADFRQLVINTGMSPEEAQRLSVAIFGLEDEALVNELRLVTEESLYEDEIADFTSGVAGNIDLAKDNPQLQETIMGELGAIGHKYGDKVGTEISASMRQSIVDNKFGSPEAATRAVVEAYGLTPQESIDFFNDLPIEVRESLDDNSLAGISRGSAEAACDKDNFTEEQRNQMAEISAEYPAYIDDAEFQLEILNANREYLAENGDESVNEAYMNTVASNAYNYDISNREDIIQMVKDHGLEGAQQILEDARKQYEEQAQYAKEQAEAQRAEAERIAEENARRQEQNNVNNNRQMQVETQQNTKKSTVSTSVSNAPAVSVTSSLSSVKAMMRTSSAMMVINSAEFKSLSAKDTVEVIKEMNATERKAAIKNIVENSEANQLQGYMFSEMKKPIIAYLVSQPTPDNASKLQFLQRYLDGDDKRFIEQLREERNRGVQQVDQNRKANPFGA